MLEHQWHSRAGSTEAFHAYLVELAASIEQLFQWVDELWLYGPGGAAAFDAEIAREDLAEPSSLAPAQAARRSNRARWRQAAALADQLSEEARGRGE